MDNMIAGTYIMPNVISVSIQGSWQWIVTMKKQRLWSTCWYVLLTCFT